MDGLLPSVYQRPNRAHLYAQLRAPVDVALAALLLIALSPLMALLALLIVTDSAGPVFFDQWRVGRRGKPFRVLKFRSMFADTPRYSLKLRPDDAHITRVGRFLRRTGLDELPQLWNVVCGEMALIGPRPEQLVLWEQLSQPWQMERHQVRPGITGWWQVHHREGSPLHHHMELDLFYVRNESLALDLRIIWKTLQILMKASVAEAPALLPVPADKAPEIVIDQPDLELAAQPSRSVAS